MREQLLDAMDHRDDLAVVDNDFVHLFSSWFNRGFLVLRRIDWSTPASILEKIIRYEAVHEIRDWEDLRRRIDLPDRRCYAFFHPALVDDPLIFVEVALTREIPGAIAPILSDKRDVVEPERATTAVFYSITNCQRGLAGVTFGHFLIKQVVEEVSREMPRISTFVTLSPAPNFAEWLKRERANEASLALDDEDRDALAALDRADWWRDPAVAASIREPLLRAAAWYYVRARNRRGLPVDAVARFHLGNGARLERLDWLGDTSERALAAVVRPDGQLPLRSRLHRAEPRGLCAAARRRRRERREPAGARAGARNRAGFGVTFGRRHCRIAAQRQVRYPYSRIVVMDSGLLALARPGMTE